MVMTEGSLTLIFASKRFRLHAWVCLPEGDFWDEPRRGSAALTAAQRSPISAWSVNGSSDKVSDKGDAPDPQNVLASCVLHSVDPPEPPGFPGARLALPPTG